MNVWLLTNSPSPYQLEFFEAIARSGRCSLHVCFMERLHNGDDPLSQRQPHFSYRVLMPVTGLTSRQELRYCREAIRDTKSPRYDIFILSGLYTNLTFLACARSLHVQHKPWLMWLEQPWPEDYHPSWSTRLSTTSEFLKSARNRLLKKLLTSATRTLCIGTAAVQAYSRLGEQPEKLINLPYHCEIQRFYSKTRREAVRHCLHVDDHIVFLYSGSLIPRKGCDLLLSAFIRLATEFPGTSLLLLGSGVEQGRLEAMTPDTLRPRVRFLGHRSQTEIPDVFQAADIFVFPSRHDGWGVVLNEAAAAGLPIIATDSTGSAIDLVEHGRTGFRIPRDNDDALYSAMKHFCEHPEDITIMGQASQKLIARYSPAVGAEHLCDALEPLLNSRP